MLRNGEIKKAQKQVYAYRLATVLFDREAYLR